MALKMCVSQILVMKRIRCSAVRPTVRPQTITSGNSTDAVLTWKPNSPGHVMAMSIISKGRVKVSPASKKTGLMFEFFRVLNNRTMAKTSTMTAIRGWWGVSQLLVKAMQRDNIHK